MQAALAIITPPQTRKLPAGAVWGCGKSRLAMREYKLADTPTSVSGA